MKNKILKHTIGFLEDRDEYQLQQIHKDLAFSGILLWYVMMALMFVSLVMDTLHNTLTFMTIALLIINMSYAITVFIKIRRKGLDDTDCASIEEYESKKKRLKKSSVISGVMWAFFMIITTDYIFPYLSSSVLEVNWFNILGDLLGGLLFGVLVYTVAKPKLQKNFLIP